MGLWWDKPSSNCSAGFRNHPQYDWDKLWYKKDIKRWFEAANNGGLGMNMWMESKLMVMSRSKNGGIHLAGNFQGIQITNAIESAVLQAMIG